MKDLIRKILKEELSDFDWLLDNSIEGKELRELILKEKVTNIPFEKVYGSLNLENTPISKKYSKEEIRQMVNVGGGIYL